MPSDCLGTSGHFSNVRAHGPLGVRGGTVVVYQLGVVLKQGAYERLS